MLGLQVSRAAHPSIAHPVCAGVDCGLAPRGHQLTNCTQLLRDGNLVGGNITFRASDFGHDVPFVMDKAAGFYAILDDVLSRATDGNPCFHEDLRSYMACIVAASCVIQAAVPAYVSMEVYAMILEQVTRFEEITWPLLRDALDHEEGSTLASDILLPEAFVCDGSEHDPSFLQLDSDSHEASQRLISELGTEHTATASMALALRVAAANSHQILDSHATNGSLDATIEKLQHVWHPVCQQLGCDHTNFWDIYLQHHKHSMAVIKTNHAGLLRSDIKLRFHLEQACKGVLSCSSSGSCSFSGGDSGIRSGSGFGGAATGVLVPVLVLLLVLVVVAVVVVLVLVVVVVAVAAVASSLLFLL